MSIVLVSMAFDCVQARSTAMTRRPLHRQHSIKSTLFINRLIYQLVLMKYWQNVSKVICVELVDVRDGNLSSSTRFRHERASHSIHFYHAMNGSIIRMNVLRQSNPSIHPAVLNFFPRQTLEYGCRLKCFYITFQLLLAFSMLFCLSVCLFVCVVGSKWRWHWLSPCHNMIWRRQPISRNSLAKTEIIATIYLTLLPDWLIDLGSIPSLFTRIYRLLQFYWVIIFGCCIATKIV